MGHHRTHRGVALGANTSQQPYRSRMAWDDRAARIDHDGPDLLWRQVADDIRASIESGELPPGAKLPSEHDLADIYQVARVTIRAAIQHLRDSGLVTVTLGRGTYVRR